MFCGPAMKPRDPARKKEMELERDHRVLPRLGNKSFRKAWPLRKAQTNRRVRRKVTVTTAQAVEDVDLGHKVEEAESMHRQKHVKEGVRAVGSWLALGKSLSNRWTTEGWVENGARHALKSRSKKG